MSGKKTISIDTSQGGNGDIWMRLVSFYTFAKILPQYKLCVYVPPFFYNLANYTFGDRLVIAKEKSDKDILYTVRGIKDLIVPILKGRKFISPYQQAVIADKKQKQFKDYVNTVIFWLADQLGVVQVPDKKWIVFYQGFLDVIGIKEFRKVDYSSFEKHLKEDAVVLKEKLQQNIPISEELIIPTDFNQHILFFPTGTSRQFVPIWWAVKYMPEAYYAFFVKDTEAEAFKKAGLKVVYFYKEPGDIIYLSQFAKWTITTDSFPSHLLQFATSRCTVVLTEVLKSRIVAPVFMGKVTDSLAPCHPCLHMARKTHPLCAAGYAECLNWQINDYTNSILLSSNQDS